MITNSYLIHLGQIQILQDSVGGPENFKKLEPLMKVVCDIEVCPDLLKDCKFRAQNINSINSKVTIEKAAKLGLQFCQVSEMYW